MRKLIPCLLLCIACDDLPTDRIDHSPPIDRTSISKETPSQWFLGRVIHGVSRLPIKGAQVRLLGTQYETLSDADGVYVLPVRAGFEQVRVYSASFDDSTTRVGETTRLWPLNVSDEDAWRVLRRRTVTVDSDDLADPDLRPEARTLLAHLRETGHWEPSLAPRDRVLKQGLQPPATIRIYRRGAENNSCTGRVDVIPLEDYVKGVVPHEWIPSWHDESLRAGSIAARSFAWGWINAGGKYDCADLDDTTRSQVYREDRTARATAAVDSTVGMAVVRDGAVVRAEYSAENSDPTAFGVDEPLCTGRELFGHGRGMCQWGSQRWATQRDQVAEWMVEHYYPGASVGGGIAPDPQPQIELRQRIARIDAITCSDPSAMFDCADFVDQSWSEGLFDLFVGHRMTVSIEVANTGASVAENVVLQVDLSGPQIAVEQVQATGAHRETAAGRHRFELGAVGTGQTTTVALNLRGAQYSAPTGEPVRLRGWVASIQDVYEKPEWSMPAVRNEGQSFNDGDLRLQTEIDVFDPRRWTWSSGQADMHEGWTIVRGIASLAATGSGLQVTTSENVALMDSPYLPAVDRPVRRIRFRSDPPVVARLWWRGPDQAFAGDRVMVLSELDTPVEAGRLPMNMEQLRLELSSSTRIEEFQLGDEVVPSEPPLDQGPPPARVDMSPMVQDGQIRNDMGQDRDGASGMGRRSARILRVKSTGGCRSAPGDQSYVWMLTIGLLVLLRRCSPKGE